MSGGWAGSTRRGRLPENWPSLVQQVKQRAGGQCEEKIPASRGGRFRCKSVGTDCDHINPGDDHGLHNLQWLCRRHHERKTAAEANAAKAARKTKGHRPPEQHPGLIRANRRS